MPHRRRHATVPTAHLQGSHRAAPPIKPASSHTPAPAAIAAALLFAACSAPPPRADFASSDPRERALAATRAIDTDHPAAADELVTLLDSQDAVARLIAINALERRAGTRLGYDWAAPEPERDAAISRWIDWLDHQPTTGTDRP